MAGGGPKSAARSQSGFDLRIELSEMGGERTFGIVRELVDLLLGGAGFADGFGGAGDDAGKLDFGGVLLLESRQPGSSRAGPFSR